MPEAKAPMLQDINFFTTYRCNSRCLNCCIWRERSVNESKVELDDIHLKQLFDDPLFQQCPNIGLAGGEPTISPFFWKLMEILPADKHVTVTTNALNSRRLVQFLENSNRPERYMIQVSVDGIGPLHDKIRGVEGSFKKAMDLLGFLKQLKINSLLSFTINQLNYFQILACYHFAREFGARFSTRMAYCGGAYENRENRDSFSFHTDELFAIENSINEVIRIELSNPNHIPSQLVFLKHITDYYEKRQKTLPCLAMDTGMVIDLYGDVFPNCPAMMKSLGSLRSEALSAIWTQERAISTRKAVSQLRCGGCWNDCQVVTNISHHSDFLNAEYVDLKLEWLKNRESINSIEFYGLETDYLLDGWYDREGSRDFFYRWTKPTFSFFVPKGTKSIELFAMIPDMGGEKRRIFGKLFSKQFTPQNEISINSGWQTYRIDLSEPSGGITKYGVHVLPGYCPREAGDGMDERFLGMAVKRIRFIF